MCSFFQLRRQLRQICPDPSRLALLEESSKPSTSAGGGAASSSYSRLHYVKRMDLIKFDAEASERYCRVMAYNETHGMLAVSQPSFTALVSWFFFHIVTPFHNFFLQKDFYFSGTRVRGQAPQHSRPQGGKVCLPAQGAYQGHGFQSSVT